MNVTTAIIDDEPLAAQLLESYVNKTPNLQLTGVYNSAIQAMKDLRNAPVQLLLLDIQMPELSGIEFAKLLPETTKVIFTTAFPQYAIEGFKVSAVDYLLKPVAYNEFVKAVDKVVKWHDAHTKQENYQKDRFMFVKSDYKLIRIMLDEILYIEGLKDYVRFYLKSGDKVMSLMSMKKLEDYLPRPEFLRTHRSFIVRMPEVKTIDRFRIVFGDVFIPISENYKESVQQYLDLHTLA